MVKVLTIRDEVYYKLSKVKSKLRGSAERVSFGDAIEHLIDAYNKSGKEVSIGQLAGSLPKSKVNRRTFRKAMDNV
jgi:predicted CopG family antitoxin